MSTRQSCSRLPEAQVFHRSLSTRSFPSPPSLCLTPHRSPLLLGFTTKDLDFLLTKFYSLTVWRIARRYSTPFYYNNLDRSPSNNRRKIFYLKKPQNHHLRSDFTLTHLPTVLHDWYEHYFKKLWKTIFSFLSLPLIELPIDSSSLTLNHLCTSLV